MRTFCITTLGCKVNQYESEQIASVLRARGLTPVDDPADANLRIINTCSVTVDAASKSRQTVRRMTRLPVLTTIGIAVSPISPSPAETNFPGQHVIVTGCWATSNKPDAQSLPGVRAVISHHDDVATRLNELLDQWLASCGTGVPSGMSALGHEEMTHNNACPTETGVERNVRPAGTTSLPILSDRQPHRQRALLKIQDGCDAHCTYCIIPRLRPRLWSKPVERVVEEARRLVDAGHQEIVLTGIFLSAFGQPTALRRRQQQDESSPLARLIDALCTRVPGLVRLRLSSLEPGDLTGDLLTVLRSHPQITPHFHVPLQSGSDPILWRMNRQYTRDDFLRMIDQVRAAFDRPAFTTDIIVGFPGETDAGFAQTLAVVDHARFIHIHAFPFSPRPGTAAARWKKDFVHGPIVNTRIVELTSRAAAASLEFRTQFVGQTMTVMVEPGDGPIRHGRSERYFSIHFEGGSIPPGRCVEVRVDRVTPARTHGSLVERLHQ